MLAAWRSEGVGTGLVVQCQGKLPGLYVIRTDAAGERQFYYWRNESPARLLMELSETPRIVAALAGYGLVYISGISLSLYGEAGRERLVDALRAAQKQGCRVAFDTNFRPRGWPDRELGKTAYRKLLAMADTVLASIEDLELLFGAGGERELPTGRATVEIVLKLTEPAARVFHQGASEVIRAQPVADVVDTTAAGDSFAAAYLAARLNGLAPAAAVRCGHRLAGEVVRHRGAIIPRSAMPAGVLTASEGIDG